MLSGCYQFTGTPDGISTDQNSNMQNTENSNQNSNFQDFGFEESSRKKRAVTQNQTTDMKSFCSRYAQLDKTRECKVLILSYKFQDTII